MLITLTSSSVLVFLSTRALASIWRTVPSIVLAFNFARVAANLLSIDLACKWPSVS